MAGDKSQPTSSLVSRLGQRLKIRRSRKPNESSAGGATKLQKRSLQQIAYPQDDINELGEREYSIFSEASTLVGTRDHTEMIHSLAHHDSFDSLIEGVRDGLRLEDGVIIDEEELQRIYALSQKKKELFRRVPAVIWDHISSFLDPADRAHLAISSKVFLEKLQDAPFHNLSLPENRHYRAWFLHHMDRKLPNHLLCFPCGRYHLRTSIGNEKLKADFVNNPLYVCPSVHNSVLPRIRLAHGRELPYSFVQLATRHAIFSEGHGIPAKSLDRRWKDPKSGWSHQTRYMIHDGRLLVRIRSQVFARPSLTPTGERMLLYDRGEYVPYFSVCAHWMDGELTKVVKCALSHIPEPRQSFRQQIHEPHKIKEWLVNPGIMARLCDYCRPARRCPECPTEYLVEVNLAEDKSDPVNRFKHLLVVTRWSDLGDGSSPTASPEYCAVNGIKADYDSFSSVGRRAVAGIFESKITGSIPGQRMISLNPKNEKKGEAGNGWY